MKTTHRLAALVASTVLVAGFSQAVLATTPAATKAPATATAPKHKAAKSIPWASLNATQKAVMSRIEKIWPNIPTDKQKSLMTTSGNWSKTSAEDQKKFIDEMDELNKTTK
ncbi:MAG TPA: DUF3106 domain-containing protein [Pseudomonadales bacterium]|nr:DUF3106 domain-containing protein [Pseudomonadales bacterium]